MPNLMPTPTARPYSVHPAAGSTKIARLRLVRSGFTFARGHGLRQHTLMEAFLVSTGIVALAEMGDKTQLLSLVLAARFRKPWPIVLGILVATLANHGLAGAVGSWVTTVLGPDVLRWVLAARSSSWRCGC